MRKTIKKERPSIWQPIKVRHPSKLISSLIYHNINLGNENAVRALIELGAKVDAEDENKETPLHYAAFRGKVFIGLRQRYIEL